MNDDETLTAVCRQVGIGILAAKGAIRTTQAVNARRVVMRILRDDAGWTVRRIAAALNRTERCVEKSLGVTAPPRKSCS